MDDSKPTINKDKQKLVYSDAPSEHPSCLIMPRLNGKDGEDKESSPSIVVHSPKNSSLSRKDSNGECKNVQSLLTEMGLQLISAPNNINLSRNGYKPRRRRGTRELQNLEFHVNYDRSSDCCRGKSPVS